MECWDVVDLRKGGLEEGCHWGHVVGDDFLPQSLPVVAVLLPVHHNRPCSAIPSPSLWTETPEIMSKVDFPPLESFVADIFVIATRKMTGRHTLLHGEGKPCNFMSDRM